MASFQRSSFVGGDEFLERTIVGALGSGGEETARELAISPVIGDAFTALPLARARVIGTGTILQVFLRITFHTQPRVLCLAIS